MYNSIPDNHNQIRHVLCAHISLRYDAAPNIKQNMLFYPELKRQKDGLIGLSTDTGEAKAITAPCGDRRDDRCDVRFSFTAYQHYYKSFHIIYYFSSIYTSIMHNFMNYYQRGRCSAPFENFVHFNSYIIR